MSQILSKLFAFKYVHPCPFLTYHIFLLFFVLLEASQPLIWANSFGPRGKSGKLPSSLNVIVQFRTYNLQVQTVVVCQLNLPYFFI